MAPPKPRAQPSAPTGKVRREVRKSPPPDVSAVQNGTLKKWFETLIAAYRKGYRALTTAERDNLKNAGGVDFRKPCQVEVFWLAGLIECEVTIISHDPNRPDGLVTIHGPWVGEEFFRQFEAVASAGHWAERPRSQAEVAPFLLTSEMSAGRMLAMYVRTVVHTLRHWAIFPPPQRQGIGSRMPFIGWCSHAFGSSLTLDPKAVAADALEAFRRRRAAGHFGAPVQAPEPAPLVGYRGTHFYPLVVLAEPPPEVALTTLILSDRPIQPPRRQIAKAVDAATIVFNDGLVLVRGSDDGQAVAALNRVFAAAFLLGIPCDAVRVHEVHAYNVDPKTLDVRGSGGPLSTLRTTLASPFAGPLDDARSYARTLSIDAFAAILDLVQLLVQRPDLGMEAEILLQAYTFHRSNDNPQAFLLAWLLVEKHISRLWEATLDAKGVLKKGPTKDRRAQLTNPDSWNAHRRLELMNFSNVLDDTTYDAMMAFKAIRNAWVHKGKAVPTDKVAELIAFAESLLRPRLDALLRSSSAAGQDER
jgi:hypothetical protein